MGVASIDARYWLSARQWGPKLALMVIYSGCYDVMSSARDRFASNSTERRRLESLAVKGYKRPGRSTGSDSNQRSAIKTGMCVIRSRRRGGKADFAIIEALSTTIAGTRLAHQGPTI